MQDNNEIQYQCRGRGNLFVEAGLRRRSQKSSSTEYRRTYDTIERSNRDLVGSVKRPIEGKQ